MFIPPSSCPSDHPAMHLPPEERFAWRLRTMRIIVAALTFGCVTFAVVAVAVRFAQNDPPPATPMISYLALGVTAALLLGRAVALAVILGPQRNAIAGQADKLPAGEIADQLGQLYQIRLIMASAMLEGAVFFLLVAYLIEGWIVTLIAAGVLIVGLALGFPTSGRMADWIEEQARWIQRQRG